jgi:probable HAF family extracellular repeat protein
MCKKYNRPVRQWFRGGIIMARRIPRTPNFLALLLATSIPAVATTFSFTAISVPGITAPQAAGINNAGEIVGYGGAGQVSNGFLITPTGVVNIFVPGSSGTQAFGVNDARQIVGTYFSGTGANAFVYSDGQATALLVPNGVSMPAANGINNAGQIVGHFSSGDTMRGFLSSSGDFTIISASGSAATEALGINNAGQIVGTYTDSAGKEHAFLDNGGVFTEINAPNAVATLATTGINNLGQVVGNFETGTGSAGYLDANGDFSTISYPGATATQVFGINDAGQVVGNYFDSEDRPHPFLAAPLAAIPEPASLTLVALAFAALIPTLLKNKAVADQLRSQIGTGCEWCRSTRVRRSSTWPRLIRTSPSVPSLVVLEPKRCTIRKRPFLLAQSNWYGRILPAVCRGARRYVLRRSHAGLEED